LVLSLASMRLVQPTLWLANDFKLLNVTLDNFNLHKHKNLIS
jgi:hypothetical protein